MDYILSKIISRPARSVHDHCDNTSVDNIDDTVIESLDSHRSDNGFCDNIVVLSSDIQTVNWLQLIVFRIDGVICFRVLLIELQF